MPLQDIVVPVLTEYNIAKPHLSSFNPKAPKLERNITFFFAGTICAGHEKNCTEAPDFEDKIFPYSGGVRQKASRQDTHLPAANHQQRCNCNPTWLDVCSCCCLPCRRLPTSPLMSPCELLGLQVAKYHTKRPGYKIVVKSPTYELDYATSKFCLGPPGAGNGKRSTLAAVMGCIPVLIGDGIYQPFEPQLDWSRFSVTVAEEDIPRLPYILDSVGEAQLAAKRVSALL